MCTWLISDVIAAFASAAREVYPLIAGIGVGGLFFPPLLAVQAAMPMKDMATSTAALGLIRQLGCTSGVSIGQAIWSSVSTAAFIAVSAYHHFLAGATQEDHSRHRIQHEHLFRQLGRQYTYTQYSGGSSLDRYLYHMIQYLLTGYDW